MTPSDVLQKIIASTQKRVFLSKEKLSQEYLQENTRKSNFTSPRGFIRSLQKFVSAEKVAIIAEIKKASPNKGLLSKDFSPKNLAQSYEENGAACISVLTEPHFFQGDVKDLKQVKQNSRLPILRKDFIVDAYQIYESRFIGADCVLLIVAALSERQLRDYYALATELKMDVLIEVHNKDELKKALACDPKLIGINNRDLHTFTVDLQTSIELSQEIPEDKIIVSESGFHSRHDIDLMLKHGIYAFLIGESLIKSQDIVKKFQELLG